MIVHIPYPTPQVLVDSIVHLPPVNAGPLFESAPGTVVLERMSKPIARDGYWEVTYNFTILPPMIGEGI